MPTSVIEVVYLLGIGLVGGIITSLVGGASLVTYPALLAAGLPPVTAVVVNLVSLMPANLSAAWWDRSQLPPFSAGMWALLGISAVGATLGAWLLLVTPEKIFVALVPLLLGLSTVLFAYAGPIAKWLERGAASAAAAEQSRWTATIVSMVPISIYGGYFGAGAGVMLLAILMLVASGDYRGANAIKNLVSGVNCLMASVVYVVQDAVPWAPVVVITAGALVGARIGVKIVRIAPREAMRRAVIVIGALLTAAFAWKYWL
jgi:uncharacterized membrane protein YfcA